MLETYRMLIGSIGDDSHSVGMSLLETAFSELGFYVKNTGILNVLEDFFEKAPGFDAIFISCMNGHADMYLEEFPYLLRRYNRSAPAAGVWYLGGNLSVKESPWGIKNKYRRMGFDFVSPKPLSFEVIMERLYRDFYRKGIKKKCFEPAGEENMFEQCRLAHIDDEPLGDREFGELRKSVLSSWHTGEEVWNTDVAANHIHPGKNMHLRMMAHKAREARPLVQPRTGVAHIEDEIGILLYLREQGLDISSIQLDAASRKNFYHKAREGVRLSKKGKTSFLNGYPVPVHGVGGVERIMQAIDTPFQVRAGSPDHRLVYEIALAGGATSVEGGFICYLYPYDKKTSPVTNLGYWKYVDKLAAMYRREYGVVVNREYFGPLTCCLIEPSIPICINIVQAILSAKSGVKCISVGVAEQGNRSQDIAALQVLEQLTRRYLTRYGFNDVTVTTVFHHYMAAFPTDNEKARELILESSVTGTLAGADRLMTKTPVESMHIPTHLDNGEGLKLTHRGIQKAASVRGNQQQVDREIQLLEQEVTGVMNAIETLGAGSVARGTIMAFEKGILDIPFSPSNYNRNKIITARDNDGAIRFVNPELLPFENRVIDFHKEQIHRRKTAERACRTFEILEKDMTRIWKNDYKQWPLDGHYVG